MIGLILFVALVFAYSLVSQRLKQTSLSPQMVFILFAVIISLSGIGVGKLHFSNHTILLVGEITLVLVLFTDASRISFPSLWGSTQLPARMLGIGLPLTILFGAIFAALLFTDFSIWEAAILATILAPTDAGLGEAVVNDQRIPQRIRQALNVESGLNDGISVPFLMLFISLAEAELQYNRGYWLGFASQQIGFGVLVGIAIGLGGGWLMRAASRRGWIAPIYQQLSLLALAIISWALADLLGGNGFIAAFVGGLSTGILLKESSEHLGELNESGGQLLNLFMFFILGIVAAQELPNFNWLVLVYALLSLTLIRMLPVAISLIGARLQRSSILFLGWFGPRGLASIVLGLVFLEEITDIPARDTIILVIILTVSLSVFAHGITTAPMIQRYSQQIETLVEDTPEKKGVSALPTRAGFVE